MRLRLAVTALGAAAAIVGTSMVILPLADDKEPAPLATASPTISVPGTTFRGESVPGSGLGGGDNGASTDIDTVVARAYTGCRLWSQNNWPRTVVTINDQGQQYRSHGDVWTTGSKIAYAYNVFSDDEIRRDRSLDDIEIIKQIPRDEAFQSTFYLRYRLATGSPGIQQYDLDDGRCR